MAHRIPLRYHGTTSVSYRWRTGVILKSPLILRGNSAICDDLMRDIANSFVVEKGILLQLGHHPRIVKSLTPSCTC